MPPEAATVDRRSDVIDTEFSGLDALELTGGSGRSRLARFWSAAWPKLAAVSIGLLIWQIVVWSGWKPDYLLPGPVPVFKALWNGLSDGPLLDATVNTLQRAVIGFALATAIGTLIGALVSQIRVLRVAVGSLITGLQTMPSIAWFPLALLLFKQTEGAILFVVVIGAAPAIANGLISGTDQIPPLLRRAGQVLGAGPVARYRHVILPGALPGFVSGLKQGWAFSWRSLMAGELLVIIANKPSVGVVLAQSRETSDAELLLATMVLILVIGVVVDSLFGALERHVARRRGMLVEARV